MAKVRTPSYHSLKYCPCGFNTTDRRAWHLHHKNVDCEHYAKVLRDREIAQAQQESRERQWAHEQAVQERAEWVSETMQAASNVNGQYFDTGVMLGEIYDLILSRTKQ